MAENKKQFEIPLYEKPFLSIEEASVYTGIGRDKLYELTNPERSLCSVGRYRRWKPHSRESKEGVTDPDISYRRLLVLGTPEQKRGLRIMPRRKNTKPEKLDIVWNVIYENINSRSIETFNVFDHGRFVEDIKKHFKTCETKELFADHLRRSVMYYFWSKCEWEVLVTPLCEGRSPVEKKIDVAWQLINNWEVFVDYVWSARPQKRENAARKNSGDGNERNREDLQDWRICETGKTESPQQ